MSTLIKGFTVGLKAAYDYQFRNAGLGRGHRLGRPRSRHPVLSR